MVRNRIAWSYFQDLLKTAHSVIVQLPSSFFSVRFIKIQQLYNYISSLSCRASSTVFPASLSLSHASDRSSRLYPVFVQNCYWYVLVSRPTLARPCDGVHGRTSLMSSSLLPPEYPACLVRHICMVLEIGVKYPYSSCFGPAVRVFANGSGDVGSIPGRVIPKTLKMELDTTLLNTQHYKVRFKGKVEQSWEWSSALPYTFV